MQRNRSNNMVMPYAYLSHLMTYITQMLSNDIVFGNSNRAFVIFEKVVDHFHIFTHLLECDSFCIAAD